MGVRRLTTFVAGAGVFERCSAGASHPISVVIDASGVIFHCLSTLDSAGNPLWLHLGPSLAIEREFTRFFQEIKVSFIDPLVVFDGVSVGRTALRQERLGQSLPMCQSTATFFAGLKINIQFLAFLSFIFIDFISLKTYPCFFLGLFPLIEFFLLKIIVSCGSFTVTRKYE